MSMLREPVIVETFTGTLHGDLVAGPDGLPELHVTLPNGSNGSPVVFRPWACPMAWSLSSPTCGDLYAAWRDIEAVMERLREAQREVEEEATHGAA